MNSHDGDVGVRCFVWNRMLMAMCYLLSPNNNTDFIGKICALAEHVFLVEDKI